MSKPKVIEVSLETIQKLYLDGSSSEKALIEKIYGKELFLSEPVKGRREFFSDICLEAGKDESIYAIPEDGTAKQKADAYYARLELIEEVLNEGWIANIADVNQRKYCVWAKFIPDSSRPFGFRLSFLDFDFDRSASDLGARPYFKDSDTAIKAFKNFTSEYEGWMYYLNLSKQKTN